MKLTVSLWLLLMPALHLPAAARPFYMGFSPWPYEATLAAQDWVYDTIQTHGDIVSMHMEEGVPWPESYNNLPFSQEYQNEIQGRLNRLRSGKKVLLQINALNMGRNGLAPYRGTAPNQPLPAAWNGLELNSDSVRTAYRNYAIRMVEYFDPAYLQLGVEVNLLICNNSSVWPDYLSLLHATYDTLKQRFPSLPMGVSVFCVPYFPEWSSPDTLAPQLAGLDSLEQYADFIAFSIHPFMSGILCDTFPDNYLPRLFGLTDKPVAVSECSYPAQYLTIAGLPFNGTPEKQSRFISLLTQACADFNARFLIWFTARDYDTLWVNTLGSSPDALPWRDTGLYDELGRPRPAQAVWTGWLAQELTAVTPFRHAAAQPLSAITVAPLPFTARLDLQLPKNFRDATASLYDTRGRYITGCRSAGRTSFSLATGLLPAGLYVLEVRSALQSRSILVLKR
jgi:hypothetical protein